MATVNHIDNIHSQSQEAVVAVAADAPLLLDLPVVVADLSQRSTTTRKKKSTAVRLSQKKKSKRRRISSSKPRRFHPGTQALREIRRMQRSTDTVLPAVPFVRLVREIMSQYNPEMRCQSVAVQAIQEAAESFLVALFEDSNLCAIHANRTTVQKQDMKLAMRLAGV